MPTLHALAPRATRRPITLLCVLTFAVTTLFLAGCQSTPDDARPERVQPAAPPMTAAERERHLESFDQVWETVRDRHFDPTFGGLDWDAMRETYRPQVETARDAREARRIMETMVGELGLSHFHILPADALDAIAEARESSEASGRTGGTNASGDGEDSGTDDNAAETIAGTPGQGRVGLDVRVLDDLAVVTRLDEDGPAAEAGVGLGWAVSSVNGRPIAPLIESVRSAFADQSTGDYRLRAAILGRLGGDPGETVEVTFLDGANQERAVELTLETPEGHFASLGEIGEFFTFESRTLDSGIGYIRFNIFLGMTLIQKFVQSMQEFRDAGTPGVIVDLRGNPGGVGLFANAISGILFEYTGDDDENLELGVMSMRDGVGTFNFFIAPRIDAYRGRIAVLIDSASASTSEILAGGLADLGRARVFGSRSAGAALPSNIERLPNGDAFQFAIANYVSTGGDALEGVGVVPHEPAVLTRETLLQGRDAVIDAAANWIQRIEANQANRPGE
ncbi:MAG: S41 family peptidase [Planctomycetota bacterium]